jgi:hypothetical protein
VAKREKSVTVFLFGGLGNQLFQYFAGLAVAEAVGAKLYLKPFGDTNTQVGNGEIGLKAFHLEAAIISSKLPKKIQLILSGGLERKTLLGETELY